MRCSPGIEVTPFFSVCGKIGTDAEIAVNFTYTNRIKSFSLCIRAEAEKAFVKTNLRLRTQIVIHSCKNNNYFVSCIGSLAYQTGVVCCFAGLDVTDNKSASVPDSVANRVLKSSENVVRAFVELFNGIVVP